MRAGLTVVLLLVAGSAFALPDEAALFAPGGAHHLLGDRPASMIQRAVLDTVWFGNVDGTGVAIRGDVWDFEDATLQGWSSENLSAVDNYFRLSSVADFTGDPVSAVLNGNWSMWVGRHEDEAVADCWPGGMGYGNNWNMLATRTFTYRGSGDVTIDFDYFQDSEEDFDFTFVYVAGNPLNTSANPNNNG